MGDCMWAPDGWAHSRLAREIPVIPQMAAGQAGRYGYSRGDTRLVVRHDADH